MTNYLIRRLFQMLAVVVIASIAIYFLLWFVPGGPLDELKFQSADKKQQRDPEEIKAIANYLGLERGPFWGYVAWLTGEDWMGNIPQLKWVQRATCQREPDQCSKGVVRLDFGASWKVAKGSQVITVIGDRLRNTLVLMVSAVFLSLLVALPVGILSAVKQYSTLDYVATTFTFFGTAMPVFWFAMLMILVFGGNQSPIYKVLGLPYMPTGNTQLVRPAQVGSLEYILGIHPAQASDVLSPDLLVHAIMPTIVLSLLYMAGWSRFMRASMLEVLRQDYVRTARAKGLIERVVIVKHAMRNALIPIVTIVVLEIPYIFGGAIMTETVFNWKGMGYLYYSALTQNDYPIAMALLFITSILVVVATLLGDILYTVVDPRIRFS